MRTMLFKKKKSGLLIPNVIFYFSWLRASNLFLIKKVSLSFQKDKPKRNGTAKEWTSSNSPYW